MQKQKLKKHFGKPHTRHLRAEVFSYSLMLRFFLRE
jgi:hypothetical protein